jgi:hypothetical protein
MSGVGFLLEAAQALGVAGVGSRQHLDRHLAAQLQVARQPDFTHPAAADLGHDPVMSQFLSGRQSRGSARHLRRQCARGALR